MNSVLSGFAKAAGYSPRPGRILAVADKLPEGAAKTKALGDFHREFSRHWSRPQKPTTLMGKAKLLRHRVSGATASIRSFGRDAAMQTMENLSNWGAM
jgi:hypothetical protein